MTQFEYLQTDTPWPKVAGETVDLPLIWEGLELGKNGWELVNVVRTPSGTLTSVFKREVGGDGSRDQKSEVRGQRSEVRDQRSGTEAMEMPTNKGMKKGGRK